MPDTFTHGYVVGNLIISRGDGSDADRLPDVVGATQVKPKFTRVRNQELVLNPNRLVVHEPIVTAVMSNGDLTGDVDSAGAPKQDAVPGVWLVVGDYTVDMGAHATKRTITVTAAHTQAAPLDLATAGDIQPPPGTTLQTVELPAGAAPGQILGWTDTGLGWVDAPEGTGGGGTGADGASAYEVAVANGFVGDETAWLESLQGEPGPAGPAGPQGDPGPAGEAGADGAVGPEGPAGADGAPGADGRSAYQVARDQGYGGTETQWLASLKGDTGATGPAGPAGPQGAGGPTGPQGERGLTGPTGADSTVPGPQGPQGDVGPVGATGPAGADGADGAQGPQGIQGATGPTGPQGPAGDPTQVADGAIPQAKVSGLVDALGSVGPVQFAGTLAAGATVPDDGQFYLQAL